MIDFQQQLQELQNSLTNNIGTGKDSILTESTEEAIPESTEIKEEPEEAPEIALIAPFKDIETNKTPPFNKIEIESIKNLEQRVAKLEDEANIYQKDLELEETTIKLFSEEELFISTLDTYLYSIIINPKLDFNNELFEKYKKNLMIISQNILANSFRFFEKDSIIKKTIDLGRRIVKEYPKTKKSIHSIQTIFESIEENLLKPSYQKNFYFAKFLNERGLILNAIAITSEILGEYILTSAKNLSPHSNERVKIALERINHSQTARRGYYHLYKSASSFFYSHFSPHSIDIESSFFPYHDTGNEEVKAQMKRIFNSNKRSKRNLFILYTNLIYRIRIIRNDLVHGNNQRHFHNISYEIEDVLIDFEYLAIQKDFLTN